MRLSYGEWWAVGLGVVVATTIGLLIYGEVYGRDCIRTESVQVVRLNRWSGDYVGVDTRCVAWEPR